METQLYKSNLKRGDRIGKGSYSEVFKGYRKDDASKTIAIKRIENDHDFFSANATKDIEALRSVTGHKNVVKLLDFHSDDEYIYIIMEYCQGGDLEDFLSKRAPPSYEIRLDIMKQCARGVAYIHGLNPPVVHRDIKCNNILLQKTVTGVVVKIGDFGLAKVFDHIDGDRNRFFMSTDAGSMAFRAPEMCTSGRKQYNASVDIYSLGLVFIVLINYDGEDKLFEPHTANEPRDTYWPYSMRQLDAYTKKIPMPELFFMPMVVQKYPQIKAIITAMTRFDFNQRTDILLIKAQLKKECIEDVKRNVAAEYAEAMELMKSQHDKEMREMNKRFSTLETEYCNEVQRKELEENAKQFVAAENTEAMTSMKSQHDREMRKMNQRFSSLKKEYDFEVQRKELEEHAKRNVAAKNVKIIALMNSQHDKEMRKMNERFSYLKLEYNNEVQRRKSLQVELQTAHHSQHHTPATVKPETQNTYRPVRTYMADSVYKPPTWSPMPQHQYFMLIDLTNVSQEYTDVEQQFSTSFKQGGGSTYTRIMNKYEEHKKRMENSNPAGALNESILWYGTTDDILTEIHTNGFNRSLCGRQETAYGRGVYFSKYTSLAHGYAKPNAKGQKHMYLCRVLTGEFTRGNSSLLVPPPKDPATPNIKFDSVVDNVASPKMYVVFQDTQTYPEYLITYT